MSEIESLCAEVQELRARVEKLEARPIIPRVPKGDCFAELAKIIEERKAAGNPL